MKKNEPEDLSNLSMVELFQVEAENQIAVLINGLLELEREPGTTQPLEGLMRAAHSFKGAARIVDQAAAVSVAHAMEDCFVAAQQGKIVLRQEEIDILFQGVDLLLHIARRSGQEMAQWQTENVERIEGFRALLEKITQAAGKPPEPAPAPAPIKPSRPEPAAGPLVKKKEGQDRMLRLTTENLNRLLGLAGESMVESRWLNPFSDSMTRLKRLQADLMQSLHGLRDSLQAHVPFDSLEDRVDDAIGKAVECREFLADRMADLEMFDRRSSNLSHRLYLEVLQCRMRPFGDGVRRLPAHGARPGAFAG